MLDIWTETKRGGLLLPRLVVRAHEGCEHLADAVDEVLCGHGDGVWVGSDKM
jgi:hypothetical protein